MDFVDPAVVNDSKWKSKCERSLQLIFFGTPSRSRTRDVEGNGTFQVEPSPSINCRPSEVVRRDSSNVVTVFSRPCLGRTPDGPDRVTLRGYFQQILKFQFEESWITVPYRKKDRKHYETIRLLKMPIKILINRGRSFCYAVTILPSHVYGARTYKMMLKVSWYSDRESVAASPATPAKNGGGVWRIPPDNFGRSAVDRGDSSSWKVPLPSTPRGLGGKPGS